MSRTVNKVILVGHLGKDPEMRYTGSGTAVTTFTIATNRMTRGADGNGQEETDWHTIVAWDKLAETCNQFLRKGSKVFIEGRLQNRSWDGQDGQKKYRTEVIAQEMIMLDSRQDGAGNGARQDATGNGYGRREPVSVAGTIDDDGLPF